jgi:hypothetical protein
MFFYTKGFLEKANQRGSLINKSIASSPSSFSRIKLRSYECPVIVRVEDISFSVSDNILLMSLFDGETTLEVNLDISKWNLCNENENKLEKGSVLIIYEYTFEDVKVSGRDNIKDMLKILECSLIGTINIVENTKPIGKEDLAAVSSAHERLQEKTIDNTLEKESGQLVIPSKTYTCDQININLNNQNWSFRAQLLKISPVKEFVNKLTNANGKFMRLQFGDSTGIIELVGFNDEIDKLQNCFADRFYTVTNADVKYSKGSTQAWADTAVTNIELVMNKKTLVEQCEEKSFKMFKIFEKPPEKKEEFKRGKHSLPLSEISLRKDGDIVSTLAVISQIEDFKEITPKNKSPINLRNFYITDQTLPSVKVAVWGKQAEEFNYKIGDILILNKIKISHFNGLSLSVQWETAIMKVEDHWDHMEEANELREWWKSKESGNLISSLKRKLSIA